MSDDAASFVGSIPEHYDRGLGPILFADFAEEMEKQRSRARASWKGGAEKAQIADVYRDVPPVNFLGRDRTEMPVEVTRLVVHHAPVDVVEAFEIDRLSPEQLHRRHAGDVLLQEGVDPRDPAADDPVRFAHVAAEPLRHLSIRKSITATATP